MRVRKGRPFARRHDYLEWVRCTPRLAQVAFKNSADLQFCHTRVQILHAASKRDLGDTNSLSDRGDFARVLLGPKNFDKIHHGPPATSRRFPLVGSEPTKIRMGEVGGFESDSFERFHLIQRRAQPRPKRCRFDDDLRDRSNFLIGLDRVAKIREQ